jgi:isopentenyldiphosphate isomerase
MQNGFWHRCVHIWVLDPDRRALLVQRKVVSHRKFPDRWCPSVTGEVLRNHSTDMARHLALQQLGLEATDPDSDRDPRVDAVRGPELELISTVLHTAPVPQWVTKVVGEQALIQEVADLYLVEVRVVSRDDPTTEGLRVKLDLTEATEARLVPYEELLRKLESDPMYIKPSEAYIKALRRGLQKRWTDPLRIQDLQLANA